jgi:branched-chain amino acid transport system ATP-binding protein
LPYGLMKRVELGRALALEPKLLILDEPFAGMNLEEKEDMVRFLTEMNQAWGQTMILVEHDMSIVMSISQRIVVLNFGEKLAEGNPDEIRNHPEVIKAYLGDTVSV